MDSSEPSLKRQRLDGLLDADPNAKAVADIISTPDLDTPWAGWATVESEPAIFNQLLREIGVSDAAVEEVYALDDASLRSFSPAHGLIFLFRWKPSPNDDDEEPTCPENIWFANQVIDNACASLALLNIVLNSSATLSKELQDFKEYSTDLTPPLKGLAVANYEHVRNIHNSFARKAEMVDCDIYLAEQMVKKGKRVNNGGDAEDDEVFHFIAYVHVGDALYELDGLRRQPVKLLTCPKEEWLANVGPAVANRISQYPEGELRFNLLAVVPERSDSRTFSAPGNSEIENLRRQHDYEAACQKLVVSLTADQMLFLQEE